LFFKEFVDSHSLQALKLVMTVSINSSKVPYGPNIAFFSKEDLYLSVKAGPDGPSALTANNIFNITSQEGIDYFCKQYKIS